MRLPIFYWTHLRPFFARLNPRRYACRWLGHAEGNTMWGWCEVTVIGEGELSPEAFAYYNRLEQPWTKVLCRWCFAIVRESKGIV